MIDESNLDLEESETERIPDCLQQYPNDEFQVDGDFDGLLGTGSFGKVYKYYHNELKFVAIKKFPITGGCKTTNKSWEMVKREAKILCRFHHPNIVEMFGITKWSNAVGIILEYVGGGTLQELLSEENQTDIAWDVRLQVAEGIVSALSYIHSYDQTKKFCHGDIKPQNILLTSGGQVRLADFGSAALLIATGASTTTLPIAPTKQYTLVYVAPELLDEPMPDKNPAMDMYSFGSVLYEVISRRAPYSNCSVPAAVPGLILARRKPPMKLINQAERQLKSEDDRSTFNFLKRLMQRCWNNDPTERPCSQRVEEEINLYLDMSNWRYEDTFANKEEHHDESNFDNTSRSVFLLAKNISYLLWILFFFCLFWFADTPVLQSKPKSTLNEMFESSDPQWSDWSSWSVCTVTCGRGSGERTRACQGGYFCPGFSRQMRICSRPPCPDMIAPIKPRISKAILNEIYNSTDQFTMLGDNRAASELLVKYKISLTENNFHEAQAFISSLRSLIEHHVDATATDTLRFGIKLLEQKRYLESIAIFDVAAALFNKLDIPEVDLIMMNLCVQKMLEANEAMIADDDSMKEIIQRHVIPLMRNWLRQMQNASRVSKTWRCLQVSWVRVFIANSQYWIGQEEEREITLRAAIMRMRKVFGLEAQKHGRLFGWFLSNLSLRCLRSSRFEEAVSLANESIITYKAAEDYSGNEEEERKKNIARMEKALDLISKKKELESLRDFLYQLKNYFI